MKNEDFVNKMREYHEDKIKEESADIWYYMIYCLGFVLAEWVLILSFTRVPVLRIYVIMLSAFAVKALIDSVLKRVAINWHKRHIEKLNHLSLAIRLAGVPLP